jgi:hypothetical protein
MQRKYCNDNEMVNIYDLTDLAKLACSTSLIKFIIYYYQLYYNLQHGMPDHI